MQSKISNCKWVEIKVNFNTKANLYVPFLCRFDFVNKEQFYNATLKFIDVDGKYNIDGKLFDTPIKNTGDFNIHLGN